MPSPSSDDEPRLEFRLPGSWEQFTPEDSPREESHITAYVEEIVGKADDRAQLRAALRMRLAAGIEAAADGSAQALFICREVMPDAPTPIVMTVYAPALLRMSPVLGTDPDAVMRAFKQARTQVYEEGESDWADLEIPESRILRVVRDEDVPLHPQAPEATAPNLQADYWYTTPGSKRIVLVSFFTPLADIREAMLAFFDGIVRASRFAA